MQRATEEPTSRTSNNASAVTAYAPIAADQDFDNAVRATYAILDASFLQMLNGALPTRQNLFETTCAAFKDRGHYSLIESAKVGGSVSMGVLGSMFNLKPSGDTPGDIDTILHYFNRHLPAQDTFRAIFRGFAVSRSVLLNTYSGWRLIGSYFGHTSKAEEFLVMVKATHMEVVFYYLRKGLNLASAIAATIIVFLLSFYLGIPLDICISGACIGINFLGVENLHLLARSYQPAHQIEIKFIRHQLILFSQFPLADKMTAIREIKGLLALGGSEADIRKRIYLRMLQLGNRGNADLVVLENGDALRLPAKKRRYVVIAIALGALGIIPQLTFAEATFKGVLNLSIFHHKLSAGAVITSLIAGGLAAFPAIGIGKGAAAAFSRFRSPAVSIGKHYHTHLRTVLELLLILLNLLAFGTIYDFSYNTTKDINTVLNIDGIKAIAFTIAFPIFCVLISPIALSLFSILFLHLILNHYSKNNGNDDVRTDVPFELGLQRYLSVLEKMSDQSYMVWLRDNIVVVDDASPNAKELSVFLKRVLRVNLTPIVFKALMESFGLNSELPEPGSRSEQSAQISLNLFPPAVPIVTDTDTNDLEMERITHK